MREIPFNSRKINLMAYELKTKYSAVFHQNRQDFP